MFHVALSKYIKYHTTPKIACVVGIYKSEVRIPVLAKGEGKYYVS